MEISTETWLSELEMEYDPDIVFQCQMMNSLDADSPVDAFNFESLSPDENYSIFPDFDFKEIDEVGIIWEVDLEKPSKQLKPDSCDSCAAATVTDKVKRPTSWTSSPSPSLSSSNIISFENSESTQVSSSNHFAGKLNFTVNVKQEQDMVSVGDHGRSLNFSSISQGFSKNPDNIELGCGEAPKRSITTMTRTPLQAQDHVLAERKRRERMTQKFIALSTLIPGLKKMDKATVLGDAIEYIKKLQGRVKGLEEETSKRKVELASVSLKRSRACREDEDGSYSDENNIIIINNSNNNNGIRNHKHSSFPEVEVRVSDRDLLIRIHCEKHIGSVMNVISELEKLHLSVISTSVMPFGTVNLDITVIAQMNGEKRISAKDLMRSIRLAIPKFP